MVELELCGKDALIALPWSAIWMGLLLTLLLTSGAFAGALTVAAHDAPEQQKAAADYVCDGQGDQEEIYEAIHALPEAGGTVVLTAGHFDIRKVEGTLGGLIIDRSDVTLTGHGAPTKLRLAADQNTNVIRIVGNGVGNITIRDLWVDQNRDENPLSAGDPGVSHSRFEYCGIKAFCAEPGGSCPEPCHDITIERCHVHNARRLGIMLQGRNLRVQNNLLGNAGSDSVELLGGPGVIMGNIVEITGQTHVAVGSDAGNSILMSNNIVRVTSTGALDIGFRSWAGSQRHVISDNIIQVDPGGSLGLAIDVRGFATTVTGNTVQWPNREERLPLWITGAGAAVVGNYLENVELIVNNETGVEDPVLVERNLMKNSTVTVKSGAVLPPRGE